jgi:hypothetical protein
MEWTESSQTAPMRYRDSGRKERASKEIHGGCAARSKDWLPFNVAVLDDKLAYFVSPLVSGRRPECPVFNETLSAQQPGGNAYIN